MVWGVVVVALATGGAHAQGSRRANAKAEAWLGKDAGDLLLQLRVDGGRVAITEDDETGETAYNWSTWNEAYTEEVVTGVDTRAVGATPGGGVMLQQTYYTDEVHHAATHRCDITFFANADGIIHRWDYTGAACAADIRKPKK